MKNQIINQSKVILLSAALIGTSLTALSVNASDTGYNNGAEQQQQYKQGKKSKHHNKEFKKMAKYLSLTDEQKVQIKAIKAEAKARNEAIRDDMRVFRAETKVLVQAEQLDEQAVLSSFDAHRDTFAQKELNRAKTKHAIYQVLTEEQRVKWQEFKAKGKKNR